MATETATVAGVAGIRVAVVAGTKVVVVVVVAGTRAAAVAAMEMATATRVRTANIFITLMMLKCEFWRELHLPLFDYGFQNQYLGFMVTGWEGMPTVATSFKPATPM